MSLTERTLRLDRELRAEVAKIADRQVRDLVTAWVAAWDEVAPDLNQVLLDLLTTDGPKITRTQLLRSQRLRQVLAVIAGKLDELAAQAQVTITGSLRDTIDKAGAAQASIIDSQLPPGSGHLVDADVWARVDPLQVEAIVERTTQQITSRTRPLSVSAEQAVRRELVRGLAAGTGPRETARRMVRRAEGGFNGGLNRAMTIARTETLDAYRAGAQVGQAQHADVLKGWVWSTNLSKRTCPACLGMHGSEHSLAEPGPLGHPNCRCTRVPVVKSWAELGFDGIDEPDSVLPDAGAFFDRLERGGQERILGKRGWVAWNAGKFPRERWATRRTAKGWRDSYVPANPPGGSGGAGRGGGQPSPPAHGGDSEPPRRVLPATTRVRVTNPAEPEYREFDPIDSFVVAAEHDPRRFLLPEEASVADALEVLGLRTLGVEEAAGKRPDVLTWDRTHRVEFKKVKNPNASSITTEGRRASLKSRRAVIDVRGSGLTLDEASVLLRRIAPGALGRRLDELGLLLDDQDLVVWSRYE